MKTEIPEQYIEVFREALISLNNAKIPYVVGGAYAAWHYTGYCRYTHDLDLYLEHKWVERASNILLSQGFVDYGETAAGDREWIFHAIKKEIMVDLIWESPNHLLSVDESFYNRAAEGTFLGIPVRFMPADCLIWTKIFTVNRQRCDWPDIFRIIRSRPANLDWNFLLSKLGDNWQVLLSCIILYEWVYPADADAVPSNIRSELLERLKKLEIPKEQPSRETILDPWIYTRGVLI